MEKYNDFVRITDDLKNAVSKMETATTRQEVEKLELETRNCVKALMVKFPYLENNIRQFALKQVSRIMEADVKSQLEE